MQGFETDLRKILMVSLTASSLKLRKQKWVVDSVIYRELDAVIQIVENLWQRCLDIFGIVRVQTDKKELSLHWIAALPRICRKQAHEFF